ncbi:unnamed protein product [Rotaria socialis]
MTMASTDQKFIYIPADDLKRDKHLGSGGFGDVYRGTWVSRRFQVAIKVFRVTDFEIEQQQKEIMREISAMYCIRFEHVLNVFGACAEPDYHALVVEYMPLGSLNDILKNDDIQLSWFDRWSIVNQMTKGINHLHQLKPIPIIHRDIKSPNFLMKWGPQNDNNRFIVKVGDFGLAKFRSDTNSQPPSVGLVGTLLWMAPELFDSESKHTKASDVYALGMCFWEVATRCIPYEGMNMPSALLHVHLGHRLEVPSDVPEDFEEIIRAAWAHDPEERPTCFLLLEMIDTGMTPLLSSNSSADHRRPYPRSGSRHSTTFSTDRSNTSSSMSKTNKSDEERVTVIKKYAALASIKFCDQELQDDDMEVIGNELSINSVCKELVLKNNEITSDGVRPLSEALSRNSTLEVLNLSGNPLKMKGAACLGSALCRNSVLVDLRLDSTRMGDEGARKIADMLRANHTLVYVGLNNNQITSVGIDFLSIALEINNTLQSIDISSNEAGVDGAKSLGKMLLHNRNLCKLYVDRNEIGDVGFMSIFDGLKRNATLFKLSVGNNNITDRTLDTIINLLKVSGTLTTIDLRGNKLSKVAQNKIQQTADLTKTCNTLFRNK